MGYLEIPMEGVLLIDALVSFQHLTEVLQRNFFSQYPCIVTTLTVLFDDLTEIRLAVLHNKVVSFIILNGLDELHYIGTP